MVDRFFPPPMGSLRYFLKNKRKKKCHSQTAFLLCLPDEYFPVLVFWSVTKEGFSCSEKKKKEMT